MDATQEPPPEGPGTASLRGFNPLRPGHSSPSSTQPHQAPEEGVRNTTSPPCHHDGFSLSSTAFIRHYSRHRILLSLPPPTKMFQFSGFPLPPEKGGVTSPHTECRDGQEVPFGNPRIQGCMLLPWAYRSLPRPSSATQAKPSPRRHK